MVSLQQFEAFSVGNQFNKVVDRFVHAHDTLPWVFINWGVFCDYINSIVLVLWNVTILASQFRIIFGKRSFTWNLDHFSLLTSKNIFRSLGTSCAWFSWVLPELLPPFESYWSKFYCRCVMFVQYGIFDWDNQKWKYCPNLDKSD